MSKMLDALKRLQQQGAAPAAMPTINNTVGQIDAVREIASAVDEAVVETERRVREEYEQKIAERDLQLEQERKQLVGERDAEKQRLEAQLSQLQSQMQTRQTESVSQEKLQAELEAELKQLQAEAESRIRDEYERKISERDRQLAEQRELLEQELNAEKRTLETQLETLQSQIQAHQSDSVAHEELQSQLEAELKRHKAEADRLRQDDESRYRREQQQLEVRLQELDASHQKLMSESTSLSEQLRSKEAELADVQQAIQAAPVVDEETLRATLSAELVKQSQEFSRKEAELHAELAEARRMVESQQNDLAEIIRLRQEEKAKFEKARTAAAAPPPVKVPAPGEVAPSAPPVAPQAAPKELPSLLLRPFSSVPRSHLVSYEEQTLTDLQDARISERYERLAQATTTATSKLFLSADGGDDAHQAGFHTALAAAHADRRVLIIDGDVHGKQLSHRLGMRDSLGFYEVIRRETKWTERVVGLRCGEVDFLPAGRSLYTVSRSDLESAQAVWQELSDIWPVIILVGEHPGAVSTELYVVLCQSIYLTACLGRATKDDVKAASKRISSIGGRIEAAIAMNAKLK